MNVIQKHSATESFIHSLSFASVHTHTHTHTSHCQLLCSSDSLLLCYTLCTFGGIQTIHRCNNDCSHSTTHPPTHIHTDDLFTHVDFTVFISTLKRELFCKVKSCFLHYRYCDCSLGTYFL